MKAIPDSLKNNATFLLNRTAKLVLEAHEQALLPLKLTPREFNMLALLAGVRNFGNTSGDGAAAAMGGVDGEVLHIVVGVKGDRDALLFHEPIKYLEIIAFVVN